ncbi:unnamed protein product [Cochlearia groenlandica]
MASTKPPNPAINQEEEEKEEGGSITVTDVEATSFVFSYSPPFFDRDIDYNPYFPFSDSYSDPDPYVCPIDFYDREDSDDFNIWGFYGPKEEDDDDDDAIVLGSSLPESVLGSSSGTELDNQIDDSMEQGLRVTSIDSDSDYEEDGVFNFTSGYSGIEANDPGLPPVWDHVFGEVTILTREELDEEEMSSLSRISSRDDDEEEHELDWQVLLTVNNVVNYIEQAQGITTDDIEPNYYMYLSSLDEYHNDDDILGQMFDNESGISGNPPASKRVVEDLPIVDLTVDELNILCAICKDDMVTEENVRRLPCKHFYHGECIIPWLEIRNTCPVCRFELPTDDLDYERHYRISQRSHNNFFIAG